MTLRPDEMRRLRAWLRDTAEDEIDCDRFLVEVGGFAELVARGGLGRPEHARLRQHLSVCPECFEEFEELVGSLRADDAREDADDVADSDR
jgi:hypothetical protein